MGRWMSRDPIADGGPPALRATIPSPSVAPHNGAAVNRGTERPAAFPAFISVGYNLVRPSSDLGPSRSARCNPYLYAGGALLSSLIPVASMQYPLTRTDMTMTNLLPQQLYQLNPVLLEKNSCMGDLLKSLVVQRPHSLWSGLFHTFVLSAAWSNTVSVMPTNDGARCRTGSTSSPSPRLSVGKVWGVRLFWKKAPSRSTGMCTQLPTGAPAPGSHIPTCRPSWPLENIAMKLDKGIWLLVTAPVICLVLYFLWRVLSQWLLGHA